MITSCVSASIDEVHAKDYITSFGISLKAVKHIKYSIPKIKGICVFLDGKYIPEVYITPVVEQLLPDLVVSVYNVKNSNPFKEVQKIYENEVALKAYKEMRESLSSQVLNMTIPSDEGATSAQSAPVKSRSEQTRIVDVVGAPSNIISIPYVLHNTEPWPLRAYYLSQLDEFSDRYGLTETLYTIAHPGLLLGGAIGNTFNHWGHELPRSMRVNNPYRYRASVVSAMHGADIATNKHYGHVVPSPLDNSCGQNCVISNVVFDPKKENIIWQEVFPNERIITPGNSDDLGLKDDRKGKGNYVFLVWRKYKGCIQAPGLLKYTTYNVGKPIKR